MVYLEAINLLESWRGRITLGDLRMGVTEPRWSVYEGAIRTLLAPGRGRDAFAVAERARARLLLEIMAERDASRTMASRQQQLQRQLRERFQERAAIKEESEQAVLDHEIARLTAWLTTLEDEAKRRDPAAGAARSC